MQCTLWRQCQPTSAVLAAAASSRCVRLGAQQCLQYNDAVSNILADNSDYYTIAYLGLHLAPCS
jgi:hypothetical protein